MASKFVVAIALFTVCHANPLHINGVYFRNGRGLSYGQAYTSSDGSLNRASGSATIGGYEVYPAGQAEARAQVFDAAVPEAIPEPTFEQVPEYGSAKAVAEAQNGYYPEPLPAQIIAYEQNYEAPAELVYEIPQGQLSAVSSAMMNGDFNSALSSASSNDAGSAESSAQTQGGLGSYGQTLSNAKTYGPGFGSAASNANLGYGLAQTYTRTQDNGVYGSASSSVNSGAIDSALAAAKTQGYGARYGSSESNANVNGYQGSAISSTKTSNTNQRRTISWRFGTLYDAPAAAQAQANTNSGFGSAISAARTQNAGYGSAKSTANTHEAGFGSANANANTQGSGFGSAKSTANTGFGNAQSQTRTQGSSYGSAKSAANTHGAGFGSALANTDTLGWTAKSTANTQGSYGSALSSANTDTGFGGFRSDALTQGSLYGSRATANAQVANTDNALSSARTQGLSNGYRASSAANLSGFGGSAQAHVLTQ